MPIYEYQCTECGKKIEVLQRMNDAPPAACEACGGPLKKLISSPSFQFKGSGWYATDYAKKGGGAGDSGGSASGGGESGSGEDSSSATKPDTAGAKSESKHDSGGGKADAKSGSGTASSSAGSSADRAKSSDSGASKPKPAASGGDR